MKGLKELIDVTIPMAAMLFGFTPLIIGYIRYVELVWEWLH